MVFYSPASLTADARRTRGLDPAPRHQRVRSSIRPSSRSAAASGPDGYAGLALDAQVAARGAALLTARPRSRTPQHRRDGNDAVPLGLTGVTGIGQALAELIVRERTASGPYIGIRDLARRVGLTVPQLEALATAGAFECFGMNTPEALWAAAGRRGAARVPAAHLDQRAAAAAARVLRHGPRRRRPVGDRHHARRPSGRLRARRPQPPRRAHLERAAIGGEAAGGSRWVASSRTASARRPRAASRS